MFRYKSLVAPFTGAWIEIIKHKLAEKGSHSVAPFTGAWIEIFEEVVMTRTNRGVAPFTGAWIEMYMNYNGPVNSDQY